MDNSEIQKNQLSQLKGIMKGINAIDKRLESVVSILKNISKDISKKG